MYRAWQAQLSCSVARVLFLQTSSILPSSLSSGYAVIFGNEVKGVKQNIVDMSDGYLEIPQFGTKHSLNVSVTAGIVVWEFAKLLKL